MIVVRAVGQIPSEITIRRLVLLLAELIVVGHGGEQDHAKPEPIKTAKEAIESRTNRSYLPDTRGGGLQCRSSLHGHDHSRHRWGIDLYLGRR
jgi:hypothetical protein